jgi:hypothetical protein
LARFGHGEWRLQRRPDEQQHGCAISLWRLNDRNVHLHEQLCAIDDNLPSNIYSSGCASSRFDLPNAYDGQCLFDPSAA